MRDSDRIDQSLRERVAYIHMCMCISSGVLHFCLSDSARLIGIDETVESGFVTYLTSYYLHSTTAVEYQWEVRRRFSGSHKAAQYVRYIRASESGAVFAPLWST